MSNKLTNPQGEDTILGAYGKFQKAINRMIYRTEQQMELRQNASRGMLGGFVAIGALYFFHFGSGYSGSLLAAAIAPWIVIIGLSWYFNADLLLIERLRLHDFAEGVLIENGFPNWPGRLFNALIDDETGQYHATSHEKAKYYLQMVAVFMSTSAVFASLAVSSIAWGWIVAPLLFVGGVYLLYRYFALRLLGDPKEVFDSIKQCVSQKGKYDGQ